jgi:hypothetical protein
MSGDQIHDAYTIEELIAQADRAFSILKGVHDKIPWLRTAQTDVALGVALAARNDAHSLCMRLRDVAQKLGVEEVKG